MVYEGTGGGTMDANLNKRFYAMMGANMFYWQLGAQGYGITGWREGFIKAQDEGLVGYDFVWQRPILLILYSRFWERFMFGFHFTMALRFVQFAANPVRIARSYLVLWLFSLYNCALTLYALLMFVMDVITLTDW